MLKSLVKIVLGVCCVNFAGNLVADERLLRSQDSVTERRKSELDPLGLSLYGFRLFPKFGMETEYDDNLFREELNPVSDFVEHLQPGFKLRSDWNRHALSLDVDSDIAYHLQNDREDYQDVSIRLNGRLDLLWKSYLEGGFYFNQGHQERGTPDDSVGRTPTVFSTKGFDVSYYHKINRFSLKSGVIAQHVDYQNVLGQFDTIINQQDRNNWHVEPMLRFGYEIQPEYEAFLELRYSEVIYDEMVDDEGLQRSSRGYEGLIGFAFDATGLLTGDVAIGYKYREYDDALFDSFSDLTGRINLEWNPTPLMTVRPYFYRDLNETTQIGVSGIQTTRIGVNIEHELLRSLILSFKSEYPLTEYKGFDPSQFNESRKESGYIIGFGMRYLMNRFVTVDLSHRFQKRNVNHEGNNTDFENNQVFLNIIVHL